MKKDKPKTFINIRLNKYSRSFSDEEILAWKREDVVKLETIGVNEQLESEN